LTLYVTFQTGFLKSKALELKYTNKIKEFLNSLRSEPVDSFVEYMMSQIFDGKRTRKAVDMFRPIVKRGFNQYINDNIRDTLKNAIDSQTVSAAETTSDIKQALDTTISEAQIGDIGCSFAR